MALWDKLMGELVDIVEWLDDSNDTLAYRFERYQNEIKYGAKLVVREGQMAVFINEGQLADVFKPGTHTLTTQNMPILATLRGWKYGFNSPFKAEVYFVSTRKFTDLKWGTPGPAMMRDKDFGMIRATAFGIYSIRVKDPGIFIKDLVGTDDRFTTDEIQENLRGKIGLRIKEVMPELGIPVIELEAKVTEMGNRLRERLTPDFEAHGPRAGRGAGAGHRAARGSREGDRQARRHRRGRQPAGVHAVRDGFRRSATRPTTRAALAGAGVGLGAGVAMGAQMANTMGAAATGGGGGAPPPVPGARGASTSRVGQQQSGPVRHGRAAAAGRPAAT